jgi:transposase-like protein
MCKKQFSVKTGTIFEDSPLGLDKWMIATWLLVNAKNGISSYEIHRGLEVTQKTAWFMLQRIRLALQEGTFEKIGGHVEVDETYIGGKARNMHVSKKPGYRGMVGKAAVMGFLERTGKVRTVHIEGTHKNLMEGMVKANVEAGSHLYTDAHGSYRFMHQWYEHQVIDHAEAYVDGVVHTNGLENYWSLLKRALRGTYVSVEPFHLFRYLDEQAFRFNERHSTDGERFQLALASVAGRRLTYRQLTGKGFIGITA